MAGSPAQTASSPIHKYPRGTAPRGLVHSLHRIQPTGGSRAHRCAPSIPPPPFKARDHYRGNDREAAEAAVNLLFIYC